MAAGVGTGAGGAVRESAALRRVRALIAHQGAQLEHLTSREMAALWPVLEQARHQLGQDLAHWLGKVDGADRFTAQQLRNALVMVDRVMDDIDLEGAAHRAVTRAGHDAEVLSARHLNQELARLADWFEGSVHPISIREAAIIAAGSRSLVPRYTNSAKRYAGNVHADLRRQMAVGYASNETFAQLTARLVRIGGPRGVVFLRGRDGVPGAYAEEISEGLFARYRGWAERFVRTEGVNAYNVVHQRGLIEAHVEDPEIKKRWDASLDGRVCPVCGGLDGQVREVDAVFSDGQLHPPDHPNCRCTETPWKEAWTAQLGPAKGSTGAEVDEERDAAPQSRRRSGFPGSADDVRRGGTVTRRVKPTDIADRVTVPPGAGVDQNRMARARAYVASGKAEPIKMVIDRGGALEIVDGRHRWLAAQETNTVVSVQVERRYEP